ncbi:cellulose binding domain-containing protein [Cellulosilyticum ruminicola]|uniref:cellulose binding domain-containing protein n=1 Tax=Cellulosilyticum ruminicola TaxID=425254 RepID=UPI0038BA8621
MVTKCSSDTKGLDVEDKSTTPGANVQQYSYWGGANQVWVLEPCDKSQEGSGSSTGTTTPGQKEEQPQQTAKDAVSAKITSDWGSGAVADITVTNTTGKDLNNWTCTFTTSRPITSVWNATIVSQSGNTYTVTGPAWQSSLSNGASCTFGCQLGSGSGLTVSDATLK